MKLLNSILEFKSQCTTCKKRCTIFVTEEKSYKTY